MLMISFVNQGLISQEELEAIHEQHDKELRNIQAEYEVKMQELILQMEERRQSELHRIQVGYILSDL